MNADQPASHPDGRASGVRRSKADVSELSGKYMTFKLAEEEYGLTITRVREIIRMTEITRVPRTREYIRGVFNLRGKVHSVLDLKCKLGFGMTVTTEHSVIIMVQFVHQEREHVMGLLVDEVLEVLSFGADNIEPPPPFGGGSQETELISGVCKHGERIIFLLDIDAVLHGDTEGAIAL